LTTQDPSERHPNRRSSERRQLDRALRECEERYQALFASVDCVFLNDFEGRFLESNPAALKLLG
jgi:PAS domain-containing protein